jgi:hypothetical protein
MSKRLPAARARLAVAGLTLLPSIVLLLAGFLAMLAFWEFGSYPAALPGLFHYRSVTWGDGLLLPLVAVAPRDMRGSGPPTRRRPTGRCPAKGHLPRWPSRRQLSLDACTGRRGAPAPGRPPWPWAARSPGHKSRNIRARRKRDVAAARARCRGAAGHQADGPAGMPGRYAGPAWAAGW